ncbi:MAG: CDP-glycerol glycerophosphotransferase family protein [Ruminococcus sp.]|nr:CDP-glycerol glycerophosphotransferase family protein [Ruminococcus sp.]
MKILKHRSCIVSPKKELSFSVEARQKALERVVDETGLVLDENSRNIVSHCYTLPIDEKAVLILGLGKSVRGNMQYILDVINKSPEFEGYTCYVRVDDSTNEAVSGYKKKNGWKRTKLFKSDKNYARYMEGCKYLITETFFPESWIKRPGQVYVNIWHGTPLKKLGLAKNTRNIPKNGNTQKNFVNADYLLYPNDYTFLHMTESYKVRELLKGKALMLGYPRCGGLLQTAAKDNSALRNELAPNGERVFVYMPTFKDYISNEEVVMESKELLDHLDENLHDDQILYVNLHHKLSDVIDYSKFRHIKKFPPLVDSYALMAVSDALITDYSSVFFDYLTLGKQIILHVEDIEHYVRARGTYMDMLTLPFDMAYSKEDIIRCLNKGKKTYDDTKARAEFCAYDCPDSADKLCRLFRGSEEGLELRDIPKSGRQTILAVSERCADTPESLRLLGIAKGYDKRFADLYLSSDYSRTGTSAPAYPLLFETPAFGYRGEVKLSYEGKEVYALYEQGRISFEKAFEVLKYDYYLNSKAMYGESEFDCIFVYDVSDLDIIMSLAMMKAKRKYLYINNALIEKLLENDKKTLDYLSAAADYFGQIFAYKANISDRLPEAVDLNADNAKWIADVSALDRANEMGEIMLTSNGFKPEPKEHSFELRYFTNKMTEDTCTQGLDEELYKIEQFESGSIEYSLIGNQHKNDGSCVVEKPAFKAEGYRAVGLKFRVRVFSEWTWLMQDGTLAVNDAKGGRKPSTKIKKKLADKKFKKSKLVLGFGERIPFIDTVGVNTVIAETVWEKGKG